VEATGISRDKTVDAAASVGGSALPGGVMMRTRSRVGIAVRREEDGAIVTEAFDVPPPKGRWARWPLMRGVVSIRGSRPARGRCRSASALGGLGARAVRPLEDDQAIGLWGKVASSSAPPRAASRSPFRIGPIVIAKRRPDRPPHRGRRRDSSALLLGMLMFLSLLRPFQDPEVPRGRA
jgi:hypothetical protein